MLNQFHLIDSSKIVHDFQHYDNAFEKLKNRQSGGFLVAARIY